MKENFSLKIADLNLTFKNGFSEKLSRRYFFFLSPSFSPASSLTLNLSYVPQGLSLKSDFKVRISNKGQVFQIKRNDFFAEIDFDHLQGEVKIVKNIYSFDSFLRIFYSVYLVLNGGFLLHSAGIKKNGKVHLFIGPSLSGKTTVIRNLEPSLTKKDSVLSDEIVAIRKKEKSSADFHFLAYPTPFWGLYLKAGSGKRRAVSRWQLEKGKIEQIYFLNGSDVTSEKKLTKKEAVTKLLENIIFFSKETSQIEKLLNLGIEFLEQVSISQSSLKNLTNSKFLSL